MFKVSTRTRYGIWALTELAGMTGSGPLNLKEISKKQKISYKYLENIFTRLKKANIVRSTRGAGGGYELAKRPEELTILDIVNSLEGPLATVRCTIEPAVCEESQTCSMRDFLGEMDEEIVRFLKSRKLVWFLERQSKKNERKKT
jgi:Rrf2 family cysteine metabolism transcriptional repressor